MNFDWGVRRYKRKLSYPSKKRLGGLVLALAHFSGSGVECRHVQGFLRYMRWPPGITPRDTHKIDEKSQRNDGKGPRVEAMPITLTTVALFSSPLHFFGT